MSKKIDHPVFDHKIISYFLIAFCTLMAVSIGSLIGSIIGKLIFPSFDTGATGGIASAVASVAMAVIFWLYFKREGYKGILKGHKFGWAFLMLAPFLAVHYAGSVVSWSEFGFSGKVLIAILSALTPGFGEEMSFRGLAVANFMRGVKDGKSIKLIFWLSSIVFGLVHLMNITAGGDVLSCIIQSVYAIGVGMVFCAVYLRTGNLWPMMIAHASVDCMEFLRGDLDVSGGVMVGMGVGDWITIAASGVGVVIALILMNKKHDEEIIALWNKKWGQ